MDKTLVLSLLTSIVGTAWAQDATDAEAATEEAGTEEAATEEAGTEEAAAENAGTEEAAAEEAAADPKISVTIELISGVRIQGTTAQSSLITWVPGQSIEFTPDGGAPTLLSGDLIASIGPVAATPTVTAPVSQPAQPAILEVEVETDTGYRSPDGFRHPNPAASRYLYAPSAIPLEEGQGYVSQKLVFTSVAYAINDNLTMLYGAFTFFPPALSVFGIKAGGEVAENVHVSVGGEAFVLGLDQEVPLALGFGAVTFGDEDRHLTIASGYAGGSFFRYDAIPLMVGGQIRFSEYAAFVTENWFIYSLNDPDENHWLQAMFVGSASLRLIGRRDRVAGGYRSMRTQSGHPKTTWDLGLLALGYVETDGDVDAYFPIPWIDWTWHFGPSGG